MLIKKIFELPYAKNIAFKGGTAAYFLHGLDRFSTDIDLDFRTLDNTYQIYYDISTLASTYGTVKKKKHLQVSYKSGYDHIKIDISRKIRKNNTYETINFYGTDIIVQDPATLVANKLVAFLERGLNRDIYDMYFFLKNDFPINEKLIKERTQKGMRDFWEKLEQKLIKLGDHPNILDGLGEVLDSKQKSFVKHKLLHELLGLVRFKRDFP